MGKQVRNILAILVILIPFYLLSIWQKVFGTVDFSLKSVFIIYPLFSVVGILAMLLLNRYFLRKNIKVFAGEGSYLLDVAFAFLLLIIFYFVFSIQEISYGRWLPFERQNDEMMALFQVMLSNPVYTIILLGPFIWITESFAAFSRAFLLDNLWDFSNSKWWSWTSIVFIALICALVRIDNGPATVISWFLVFLATNYLFFRYRRVLPLILAGILYQTISLGTYWYYNFFVAG
ncbi:MAG: hypothetical protein DWQ02_06040 [Bacteroidetes bacterium]|nr:MAG: hypothetical protein DWQ02_06040 [Bacteroidota bacterium]